MKDWNELKDAFAPAPERFALRMQSTFDRMEELTAKRRHRLTLVSLVAILVLLFSVALAAASFGVLDLLSYTNEDGSTSVNEELREHVQPVELERIGSAARVRVTDAICDGQTLSLAWVLENISGREIYVSWYARADQGQTLFGSGGGTAYEFFLNPGESREGGLSYTLDPAVSGDSLQVDVGFRVLAPTADIVEGEYISDTMTREEQAETLRRMEQAAEEGKLVVIGGEIELPYSLWNYDKETKDEALARLGLMEPLDSIDIGFPLQVTGDARDILPKGEPVVKQMDGFQIILSEAQRSPTQLQYTIDFVFENEDSLRRFQAEREGTIHWAEAEGSGGWYGNGSGINEEPVQQEDGTWLLRNRYILTEIFHWPESITITSESWVPAAGRNTDGNKPVRNIPEAHPEEAFPLVLREPTPEE